MRRRALLLAAPALLAALSAWAPSAPAGRAVPPAPALRPDQYGSLVLLGRVWGFAKYHHPRFAVDGADVDSALFAAVPRVLAASTGAHARDSVAAWLDGVGAPPPCVSACATPVGPPGPALAFAPDTAWIGDTAVEGPALAARLARIHASRPRGNRQHYVQPVVGVANPAFVNEPVYGVAELDRPEVRLLGVFRLWNILEYWFPYRDLMDADRVALLRDAVPAAWRAAELDDEYRRVLLRLIARAGDTHANVWNSVSARPPAGGLTVPVALRMIEGRPVVAAFSSDSLGPRSGLRVGDAILAVDGVSVDSLFGAWSPFYAASNEPTRQRDMARSLLRGAGAAASLLVERNGRRLNLRAARVRPALLDPRAGATHDLPGDTFRLLSPEVAYVKLGPLKRDSIAAYLERARDAAVLVVDHRNYPSDFPIFSLGSRLVTAPTPFARFTRADWANPGAFVWDEALVIRLRPQAPAFAGRVVILVDEVTQSSAEYHAMAFRVAPGALVVGSTTAGADGNVSRFTLPGGMQAAITGIGTFYPDRRPTQRVGIVPDLEVRPTLAGFRAGRDEVLEAGVSRALGRTFRLAP